MRCAESQNPLAALSFLKDIVVQSFFYQRDSVISKEKYSIGKSPHGMRFVEIDASGVNLFSHFA